MPQTNILEFKIQIRYRKMDQDHVRQTLQCVCTQNLPHNGFFGKPTKLRNLQPSMFQLLTWTAKQSSLDHIKINYRQHPPKYQVFCQCCCHNASPAQGPQIEEVDEEKKKGVQQSKRKVRESIKKKEDRRGRYEKKVENKVGENYDPQTLKYKNEKTTKRQITNNDYDRPKSAKQNRQTYKAYNMPKSPNFKTSKTKHLDDENSQQGEEVNQKQLIKKFKQTTRWIPNSAFTTYFGKPAFENYGRGNTKPTSGGLLYGNYLKTHNVQPHRGMNSPKNIESYGCALMKAEEIGTIYPYPPKVGQKQSVYVDTRSTNQNEKNSIYPQRNESQGLPIKNPNLTELQKFGGKGMKKVVKGRFERLSGENGHKNQAMEKEEVDYIEKYRNWEPEYEKKKSFPPGKKIQ